MNPSLHDLPGPARLAVLQHLDGRSVARTRTLNKDWLEANKLYANTNANRRDAALFANEGVYNVQQALKLGLRMTVGHDHSLHITLKDGWRYVVKGRTTTRRHQSGIKSVICDKDGHYDRDPLVSYDDLLAQMPTFTPANTIQVMVTDPLGANTFTLYPVLGPGVVLPPYNFPDGPNSNRRDGRGVPNARGRVNQVFPTNHSGVQLFSWTNGDPFWRWLQQKLL